ncbi:MAG: hypothetical protein PHT38_04260 [Halothiobacillus sp.]|jgi:hypothetical protein|nr:hypothetical protein [Halothiobacillus sp.]
MQELEKNRDRIEHDILMMQVQIEHYKDRARLLRIMSTILVVLGAGLIFWMLPAFLADIGPGTAPFKEYTPVRFQFSLVFLGFVLGFVAIEHRLNKARTFARKLGVLITEKQENLKKII